MKQVKKRTEKQNRSFHKGFTDISNILIENGVSLNAVIKNLEIRPTPESVKEIYKAIAYSKYGVKSTTELTTSQIDPVWEDLIKAISIATGVYIVFPSEENREAYINSLDN